MGTPNVSFLISSLNLVPSAIYDTHQASTLQGHSPRSHTDCDRRYLGKMNSCGILIGSDLLEVGAPRATLALVLVPAAPCLLRFQYSASLPGQSCYYISRFFSQHLPMVNNNIKKLQTKYKIYKS